MQARLFGGHRKVLLGALCAVAGFWAAARGESWKATADPRPGLATLRAAETATGPAALRTRQSDPYYIKPDLNLSFKVGSRELYPGPGDSRFMLTHGSQGWEVWDLGLGRKVRGAPGRLAITSPQISPNGELLMGNTANQRVGVYSLLGGRQLMEIGGDGAAGTYRALNFITDDLVLVQAPGADACEVFDVKAKKSHGVLPGLSRHVPYAFSPGGKYVAMATFDGTLRLLEVAGGKEVGVVPPVVWENESHRFYAHAPTAIAYSPDGEEITVWFHSGERSRFISYDARSGEVLQDALASFKLDRYRYPLEFAYLPDQSGWVINGMYIVDAQTLQLTHTFDFKPPHNYEFRMASPREVVIAAIQNQELVFRSLDAQPVTGAEASSRPAAKRVASNLPNHAFYRAKAMPWVVKPRNETLTVRVPAERVMLKNREAPAAKRTSSSFGNNFRGARVLYTNSATGSLLVQRDMEGSGLARYNVVSGELEGETPLPREHVTLDVSPDGKYVAILQMSSSASKLAVFEWRANTYELLRHIDAVPQSAVIRNTPGGRVNADHAAFLPGNRLVLCDARGRLACFDVTTGDRVWVGESVTPRDGRPGVTYEPRTLAVSPDGAHAAVTIDGGLCIFDAATGQPLNSLPSGGDVQVRSMAFSAGGTRLAAVITHSLSTFVQVYDLKTGRTVSEAHVPEATSQVPPHLLGGDFLLVQSFGGVDLVSLSKQAVAWRYRGAVLTSAYGRPHAKPLLFMEETNRMPAALVRLDAPHAEVASRVTAMPAPEERFLWTPGRTVRLELQVSDGDANAYRQRWESTFKAQGITISDQSENVLRANHYVLSGPSVPARVTNTSETVTFTPRVGMAHVTLTVKDQQVWSAGTPRDKAVPPSYGPPPVVYVGRNQSVQDVLNAQAASIQSPMMPPPTFIYRLPGVPASRITLEGLKPEMGQ